MNRVRTAALFLALIASLGLGCGTKSRSSQHGSHDATPQLPPPTPDTTPIEALRTPAGVALKIDAPTPVP
ncbi:MAG: hypothetical protein ABI968_06940, partial [Acidobacteriota bacterium]